MRDDAVLFDDLARVRALLSSSPLVPSLEAALEPLSRAVEALRTAQDLTSAGRERLLFEVSGIDRLLNGFGQWFVLRAPPPTYNRRAELEPGGSPMRGTLMAEG